MENERELLWMKSAIATSNFINAFWFGEFMMSFDQIKPHDDYFFVRIMLAAIKILEGKLLG